MYRHIAVHAEGVSLTEPRCTILLYHRRVQAATKMKAELGLSEDLNASDAVVAGAELLGVSLESLDGKSLTLKERVAVLCREAVSWNLRTDRHAPI